MLLIKVSVLQSYLIALEGANGLIGKHSRRACWSMIAIVTLYFLICLLTVIFACTPISKSWDIAEQGFCFDGRERMLVTAIFNLLIDITVIALPIPVVLRLQLSKASKLSIWMAIGAGWLYVHPY